MARYVTLKFESDDDAERFLRDVEEFGSVPIPDGRQYGEYPCKGRDITGFMRRLEEMLEDISEAEGSD